MRNSELYLRKWGNSLAVRLPAAVAREAGLRLDQRVRLEVDHDCVVIRPLGTEEPTLKERLERFDPARHGGEAIADPPVGAERW